MVVKNNEEQAVSKTVRTQIKAMIEQDIPTLKSVIAPNAKLIHITGAVQSRDEWLKQIKIGRMHYFGSREVLFQVTMKDETHAEVISRNELDARIYGFRNTWPLESRAEVEKINGKWLITKSSASMF